jgi:phosphatidylglycerol:prolipoprotein diacylglycerol transferase
MPNGFDIPIPFLNQPFHIYFYGILITMGMVAATLLAHAEAKRRGQNPEILWDMLIWVVIAGIVGARIWHILTPPPSMIVQGITTQYYLTHPLLMIDIRNGGLGIPGAVIGGILAMWIYTRRKNLNLVTWLDITAPGLALAQAIGRWGNFFNQELYGAPTNFILIPCTACQASRNMLITTRSFCTNPYGTWPIWPSCSGCRAVFRTT